MRGIVIKRILNKEEIKNILSLLKEGNIEIYTSLKINREINDAAKELLKTDEQVKKDLNYETLRQINEFGDKKVNGKSIGKILTYDYCSLWHYHKFRIYFNLLNLKYEIEEIKLYSKKYEKVDFYTDFSTLSFAQDLPENVKYIFPTTVQKPKMNIMNVLKYILSIKLRIIYGLIYPLNFSKKKHIIIDRSERQSTIDNDTLKSVKGNYTLLYLFSAINEDYAVMNEEIIPKFHNAKKYKPNYLKRKSYEQFPSELIQLKYIFNLHFFKHKNSYNKFLFDAYSQLYSLEGIDKTIFLFFRTLHSTSIFYLFRYNAFKRFFGKHSFKTVMSSDENSGLPRSILDAAKANGIKTIGIQHGNIHELHPAYMFTKEDRERKIMCDYTFVWGQYYRDLLVNKGAFPNESIIITGQIRTDIIPKLLNKDKELRGINIPNGKKIIVFASQPQRDKSLRESAAKDVFDAVKEIDEAYLIIKLHPGEMNDFEYYNEIGKKRGCKNFKIIYYYDLYMLLSAADIVITCFSTVGTEAVYFGKPLIILDHLKQDIQNYYKEGVGFLATNADELKNITRDLLNNKQRINPIAYEKYIEKYGYKIDGKVVERCMQFVNRLS